MNELRSTQRLPLLTGLWLRSWLDQNLDFHQQQNGSWHKAERKSANPMNEGWKWAQKAGTMG